MSILNRLLEQLQQRGLSIQAGNEPDQLLLCGPSAEKTQEVLEAVRAFKPALLERFGRKTETAAGPAPAEPEPVAETTEEAKDEADEWEQCPLCLADVHPQDAARLCNPLTRPRAVLNVAPDGTMTTVRTPRCHYETKPPNGEC